VNEIGCVPVQVPLSTVTVCPTCAVPCGSGCFVASGLTTDATTPVGLDAADELPTRLVAVTTTRRVLPTSDELTVCVCPVAPEMSPQLPPEPLQRCQRNM
jgi:hypothetical protein